MQNKESKKCKVTNNKNISSTTIDKKLISKNRNSKIISNNSSNTNIHRVKTIEQKISTNNQNKFNKINNNIDNDKQNNNGKEKEKEKKSKNIHNPSNYHDKINNDKKLTKTGGIIKQKTSTKLDIIEEKKKCKIIKKNSGINESKKNPLLKNKDKDNINEKKKKKEVVYYKSKNIKKERNKNENSIGTQRLLDFLIALTPIDTSKCEELINNNMNKIIELERDITDIVKITQGEIEKILNNEKEKIYGKENKSNRITTKQNIEIINKESYMRKKIYILFFNFITQLLEQINQLSNNITNTTNQETNDLNNINDTNPNNDLFINNNSSVGSNNSLFVSNIEEEFCERLINLTKSFISSDIDIGDLNSNNGNRENKIEDKKDINLNDVENENIFNDEDYKNIESNSNEFNSILKSKSKKMFMIHPNEILDKIQNEDKKERKVLHHYSNSLKVNSNLEKLEGKINTDDDNINEETIKSHGNLERLKNCNIF